MSRFAHLCLDDDDKLLPPVEDILSGRESPFGMGKDSKENSWEALNDASDHKPYPRGLVNRSNFCYLNAVLQPLLLCQPFINVILNMADSIQSSDGCKWLSAFLQIISAFVEPEGGEGTTRFRNTVSPEAIYQCWDHSDDQEDAEEFLRLILNGLHEELLKHKDQLGWSLPLSNQQDSDKQKVDDEWMSIGKGKKRLAKTRSLTEPSSPISVLFYGQFKTVISGSGKKDSHIFEPFQILPVDITNENINTLQQAIESLSCKEKVDGKTHRQLLIDRLPPVLIIQLKRFVFDPKTMHISKSLKPIEIPHEMDLGDIVHSWADLLYFKSNERPKYRLYDIVYHLGRTIHGGHYTCHVYHDEGWLFCDDGAVQRAPREVVGQMDRNRTPYLLFYARVKEE